MSKTSNKKKRKQKQRVKDKPQKIKLKLYVGYYSRIIIMILLALLFSLFSMLFMKKSIIITRDQRVSYTEKSNLDYKVYLKENDFYESKYLGKNMSYIANIIDYIDVSFNYNFAIDNPIDASFKYKIIAILNINNEDSSNTFLSKEYTLLDEKTKNIKNEKKVNISESVKIDYDYYNRLANSFKQTYGVNTTSDLKVYLKINRDADFDSVNSNELDNNNSMLINIPLSQKAISIKMEYDEINNNDSIMEKGNLSINDFMYFSIGLILLIFTIILIINIFKKISLISDKTNNYDKFIKRILKEYDRLIVITQTMPDLTKFNVFKINNFGELLDVRYNTKKPIMYYSVVEHTKCYFYLKDDNDIYLLCIKAVDMDKKN